MTTTNPFLGAADIIIDRGWTQNAAFADDGSVCIMRALWIAFSSFGASALPAGTREVRAHRMLGGLFAPETIAHWNDDPKRTRDDVLLVLKRCAEEWDA